MESEHPAHRSFVRDAAGSFRQWRNPQFLVPFPTELPRAGGRLSARASDAGLEPDRPLTTRSTIRSALPTDPHGTAGRTLERFIGVEHDSCCVAFRVMARHWVHNAQGDVDNAVYFELEFKGVDRSARRPMISCAVLSLVINDSAASRGLTAAVDATLNHRVARGPRRLCETMRPTARAAVDTSRIRKFQ